MNKSVFITIKKQKLALEVQNVDFIIHLMIKSNYLQRRKTVFKPTKAKKTEQYNQRQHEIPKLQWPFCHRHLILILNYSKSHGFQKSVDFSITCIEVAEMGNIVHFTTPIKFTHHLWNADAADFIAYLKKCLLIMMNAVFLIAIDRIMLHVEPRHKRCLEFTVDIEKSLKIQRI